MILQEKIEQNRGYIFSIIIAVIPVFFVWHTELVFDYTGRGFTNGFMRFDGLKIYHILMYMMFTTNFLASIFVAKRSDNI